MTSLRQIEANRRNALKSTGPTTSAGKDRSRRNALRHGLSAETVVTPIEDMEDYLAFEATIIADHDAQTAVERELVLRLASLLWRLRRATSIETGLLQAQAVVLGDHEMSFEHHESASKAAILSQRFSHQDITECFAFIANANSPVFERVRRYETTLWHQLRQILFTLKLLKWKNGGSSAARPRTPWSELRGGNR
jgi:hypothetical protein